MSTITKTHARSDIRRVARMFREDLDLLASNTDAMDWAEAAGVGCDVELMAISGCLVCVHLQLWDSQGGLKKAHVYTVEGDWDQDRPGANDWPRLAGERLRVVLEYSDMDIVARLKSSGQLKCSWGPSDLPTNYEHMASGLSRRYSSGSYGWNRESFGP